MRSAIPFAILMTPMFISPVVFIAPFGLPHQAVADDLFSRISMESAYAKGKIASTEPLSLPSEPVSRPSKPVSPPTEPVSPPTEPNLEGTWMAHVGKSAVFALEVTAQGRFTLAHVTPHTRSHSQGLLMGRDSRIVFVGDGGECIAATLVDHAERHFHLRMSDRSELTFRRVALANP